MTTIYEHHVYQDRSVWRFWIRERVKDGKRKRQRTRLLVSSMGFADEVECRVILLKLLDGGMAKSVEVEK